MPPLICPIPSSAPDYVRTSSRPPYRTRRHLRLPSSRLQPGVRRVRHPGPTAICIFHCLDRKSHSAPFPDPRSYHSHSIPYRQLCSSARDWLSSFWRAPVSVGGPVFCHCILSSVPIMPVCTCSSLPSVRERISLAALFYTAVRRPHTRSSLRHRSAPLHSVHPRLLQP